MSSKARVLELTFNVWYNTHVKGLSYDNMRLERGDVLE